MIIWTIDFLNKQLSIFSSETMAYPTLVVAVAATSLTVWIWRLKWVVLHFVLRLAMPC